MKKIFLISTLFIATLTAFGQRNSERHVHDFYGGITVGGTYKSVQNVRIDSIIMNADDQLVFFNGADTIKGVYIPVADRVNIADVTQPLDSIRTVTVPIGSCNATDVGLFVVNNTVLGFRGGTAIFQVDDNSGGLDNSMLCENNLVSLGGNTTNYYAGTNMTVINNSINKNGFTLTQAVHANDDLTAVVIGATGVPASRIDDGVAIAGATVGLASDYSIPDAITYENQDANWQRGAVVL